MNQERFASDRETLYNIWQALDMQDEPAQGVLPTAKGNAPRVLERMQQLLASEPNLLIQS